MLAVENFTNKQLAKTTLENGHNTLLASKTLVSQANIMITYNFASFRKSICKLLRIEGLVCMAPGFWLIPWLVNITNIHWYGIVQLWMRNLPVNVSQGIAMIHTSQGLLTLTGMDHFCDPKQDHVYLLKMGTTSV